MRLENLYPNFYNLSPVEQQAFVASLRAQRFADLEQLSLTNEKDISTIELSPEAKTMMKALGIKKKDMINLMNLSDEPDEEADSLFTEEAFMEVKEED